MTTDTPRSEWAARESALLFEIGSAGSCAVSLPDSDVPEARRDTFIPRELLADEYF